LKVYSKELVCEIDRKKTVEEETRKVLLQNSSLIRFIVFLQKTIKFLVKKIQIRDSVILHIEHQRDKSLHRLKIATKNLQTTKILAENYLRQKRIVVTQMNHIGWLESTILTRKFEIDNLFTDFQAQRSQHSKDMRMLHQKIHSLRVQLDRKRSQFLAKKVLKEASDVKFMP